MEELNLDILQVDLYSDKLLGIIDNSYYPDKFNISSPTLEITPPGYDKQTVFFIPKSLNVINAAILNIDCDSSTDLPDGLYKIRYSVAPILENYINYNFYRTTLLDTKFDKAVLSTEIGQCDGRLSTKNKIGLDEIYYYIIGCKAAAKECDFITANKLYNKASSMLNQFSDKNKCNC